MAETSTWQAQDAPYEFTGDIYVQSSTHDPVLTIEDGTELRFDGTYFYVGTSYAGNLVVDGHTEGVTMTAAADSPSAAASAKAGSDSAPTRRAAAGSGGAAITIAPPRRTGAPRAARRSTARERWAARARRSGAREQEPPQNRLAFPSPWPD